MVYSQPDEKVYVGSLKKGELFNKHVKVFESFEDLAIEEALSKINDNSITISNNKIS